MADPAAPLPAVALLANELGATIPPHDRHQPIIEHLIELRRRVWYVSLALTIACALGYLLSDQTFAILTQPLKAAFGPASARHLIYTGLPEAFLTKMKLAFFTAFLLTFPFIAIQIYLFIAPGLYRHEKRMVVPYLIAAPILFFLGAALAYFVIFPAAFRFFISFETPGGQNGVGLPIELEARMSEYLTLIMHIILAFGVSFQLPVILTLLVRMGVLSVEGLKKGRRYAVIGLMILAGIFSPPDVASMLELFSALYLLYECSIIACRWVVSEKKVSE